MMEHERMNVTEHIEEKLRHRQHRSEITEQNQSVTSAQFVSVFCIRCARFICENCCCWCRFSIGELVRNQIPGGNSTTTGENVTKSGSAQFLFLLTVSEFLRKSDILFFVLNRIKWLFV